jgi:hypothetical protein
MSDSTHTRPTPLTRVQMHMNLLEAVMEGIKSGYSINRLLQHD